MSGYALAAQRRLDRKNPTLTGYRWQFDDIVCTRPGAALAGQECQASDQPGEGMCRPDASLVA
ncbi:hypothetical protein [Pandoraea sputorum]|uniref:hypothetical protein n=1 Tax=Pandoraea sputorum TaxID=93222 RepID=UPI0012401AF4|nr:hypothetical protein [Pandoraea sputorum]